MQGSGSGSGFFGKADGGVKTPPPGGGKEDAAGGYPLSLATLASSPKGTPLRYAGNFPATAKAVPLGKVA